MRIEATTKGFEQCMKRLEPVAMQRAVVDATNRTAAMARTAAIKTVGRLYNLPAKMIKEKSTLLKAKPGQPVAFIWAKSNRGMSLAHFGAKQTKRGVSVAVKRGGRKMLPGAFMATMPSGHRGVFYRSKSGKGRVRRYPIQALYGPSIALLFASRAVSDVVRKTSQDNFPRIFQSRYDHYRDRGAR